MRKNHSRRSSLPHAGHHAESAAAGFRAATTSVAQAVVEAPMTVAIASVFAALTEADRNGMGQIHFGNRLRAKACMERTKGAL
jgi:hypothetical protein